MQREQQPANAEAKEQATALLRELREQGSGWQLGMSDSIDNPFADVPLAEGCDVDAEEDDWGAGQEGQGSSSVTDSRAMGLAAEAAPAPVSIPPSSGKPLVDAPEFGDRLRDTDKQPYWIPGAFPTIFQNETGRGKKDYNFFQLFKLLYDFELKEISAEMHGDLERFFVQRPVSHFHRLIDVFYRVSVAE